MQPTTTQPNSDAIARHAYFIWEKEGRPPGRDLEFWTRAEQELRAADFLTDDQPLPFASASARPGGAHRAPDSPSPVQPATPAKPRSRTGRNRTRSAAAL